MKRLLCMLLMLLLLSGSALAAASVAYEGGAEKFVFLPGSATSSTDLFEGFKGVMPGDELTQTIMVKNATGSSVRIYMRAEPVSELHKDFLSQLSIRVECKNKEIFDAAPSETAQLTNNTLLGTFKKGGSTELSIKLAVPITLGNEYMNSMGIVPWVFVAEEISETSDDTPHTGDWFQTGVWIGAALLLSASIVILLVVLRRRSADKA